MIKVFSVTCFFLLGFVALSQTKFVLGQYDKVGYFPSYEWPEIDSIVGFAIPGEFVPKEDADVFFDADYLQLAHTVRHHSDSIWMTDFWTNGQIKKRTLYIEHSIWWHDEVYCQDGNLIFDGPSLNQTGQYTLTSYYCNGQKRSDVHFQDSEPHGTFHYWYDNGQMESEATYIRGSAEGEWNYWNKEGNLIRSEIYLGNRLIDSK